MKTIVLKTIVVLLAFGALASADTLQPKPNGGVCPSIGGARTCDKLVFLTPKGTVVTLRTTVPDINAADGDQTYLIVNDSGKTVSSFLFLNVSPGDFNLCEACTFTVIGNDVLVTFDVPLTSNKPGDLTWITLSNPSSIGPPPPPTPEPSTIALAITGLLGLWLAKRTMRS